MKHATKSAFKRWFRRTYGYPKLPWVVLWKAYEEGKLFREQALWFWRWP